MDLRRKARQLPLRLIGEAEFFTAVVVEDGEVLVVSVEGLRPGDHRARPGHQHGDQQLRYRRHRNQPWCGESTRRLPHRGCA